MFILGLSLSTLVDSSKVDEWSQELLLAPKWCLIANELFIENYEQQNSLTVTFAVLALHLKHSNFSLYIVYWLTAVEQFYDFVEILKIVLPKAVPSHKCPSNNSGLI